MSHVIKLTLTFAAVFAIALCVYFAPRAYEAQGSAITATVIGSATTTSAINVTSSTRVLSTTTNTVGTGYTRTYATICNASSNVVFLLMNNDKQANASTTGGVPIAAAA